MRDKKFFILWRNSEKNINLFTNTISYKFNNENTIIDIFPYTKSKYPYIIYNNMETNPFETSKEFLDFIRKNLIIK